MDPHFTSGRGHCVWCLNIKATVIFLLREKQLYASECT